jgi:hypothetical protein
METGGNDLGRTEWRAEVVGGLEGGFLILSVDNLGVEWEKRSTGNFHATAFTLIHT